MFAFNNFDGRIKNEIGGRVGAVDSPYAEQWALGDYIRERPHL
jgi:hypothetical protein